MPKPKLIIEIEGEEVLMIFQSLNSYREVEGILEDRGKIIKFDDKVYVSFHDPIPQYNNQILNHRIRREEA